jgi:hypothetical protein
MDENGQETVSVKSVGAFWKNASEDIMDMGAIDFDLGDVPSTVLFEGKNPLCPNTYSEDENMMVSLENAKNKFHSSLTQQGGLSWFFSVYCPVRLAGGKVNDQLMVSVTLFRRDDWHSFCVAEDVGIGSVRFGEERLNPNYSFVSSRWSVWDGHQQQSSSSQPYTTTDLSPFARNCSGSVAHEVLESKKIRELATAVKIEYFCVLPPPGAPEEPAWLELLRRMFPPRTEWTAQMDDDLAQSGNFSVSPCFDFLEIGSRIQCCGESGILRP